MYRYMYIMCVYKVKGELVLVHMIAYMYMYVGLCVCTCMCKERKEAC